MSIYTEGDRQLDIIKSEVIQTQKDLANLIYQDTDAFDEFNADFKQRLRESLHKLGEISNLLGL